jgi:aquaporin Z
VTLGRPGPAARPPEEEGREASVPRRLLAETVGTFFLTFVAAGGSVIDVVTKGQAGTAAKLVAPGVVVMALIYSLGDVSGAHFNPAVTLAFALRGVFRWRLVPAYWAAQLVAASGAAAVLLVIFGNTAGLGATRAHVAATKALTFEVVLTLLLLTVILNTATRARVVGPNAAIAVGGTIALAGLIGGPISGGSMNPARSLGPDLVGGHWTNAWIYVVGPIVGATIAVAVTAILHPVKSAEEIDAAEGDGDHGSSAARLSDASPNSALESLSR